MMIRFPGLLVIALLISLLLAYADNDLEVASKNRIGVAKFALLKTEYGRETIFVVDETLNEAALSALRGLGPVVSRVNYAFSELAKAPR